MKRKSSLLLEKPTSLEFVDAPLEKCVEFLKDYHKINIWIDRRTLTDEGVALISRSRSSWRA